MLHLQYMILVFLLVAWSAAADEKHAKCKENEKWVKCGTCEGTCKDRHPVCTKDCKPPMCLCPHKDGYVRFGFANACIHVSKCPKTK